MTIPTESHSRTLTEHQKLTGEDVWKIEKSEAGRPLCRWCRKEVPKGKRTFCGDPKCVEEWKIRNSQAYARRKTYERDRGICVRCGTDTNAIAAKLIELRNTLFRAAAGTYEKCRVARDDYTVSLVQLGFDKHAIAERILWQMDHIVEVVNGGGTCGLDNCQTLCVPCHKGKTKELAHARALARASLRQQSTELSL